GADRRLGDPADLVAGTDSGVGAGGPVGVRGGATNQQEAGGENTDVERLTNPRLHCGICLSMNVSLVGSGWARQLPQPDGRERLGRPADRLTAGFAPCSARWR